MNLLCKYHTAYCADSVEWCPITPYQHLFVCGNYELEKDTSNGTSDKQRERFGRILLFEYINELKPLQTIDTAAVLDQKWCHNTLNNYPVLAVTTAQGSLDLYRLEGANLQFWMKYTFEANEKERLLLSVDWSTGKHSSQEPHLTVSDNQGNMHLFQLSESGLQLVNSWKHHSHEAWICAFDYWNPKCLFSGADDGVFIKTDTESGAVVKNKSHECGVTSMHSNSGKEHVFATGSYDTYIRIWDTRMLKAPQASVQMLGPVWRVKWHPTDKDYLISACMDGGVSIVQSGDTENKIVNDFQEHESIAYGADWYHGNDVKLVASCSFYDRLLCLATY